MFLYFIEPLFQPLLEVNLTLFWVSSGVCAGCLVISLQTHKTHKLTIINKPPSVILILRLSLVFRRRQRWSSEPDTRILRSRLPYLNTIMSLWRYDQLPWRYNHSVKNQVHLIGCEVEGGKGRGFSWNPWGFCSFSVPLFAFILEITFSTPTVRAPFGDMNHKQDVDHLFPLIAIFLYVNVIHFCVNDTIWRFSARRLWGEAELMWCETLLVFLGALLRGIKSCLQRCTSICMRRASFMWEERAWA